MALEKWDLWVSYGNAQDTPAYKDLEKFLLQRKSKAMEKLKREDNAVARATWILVDEIFSHVALIQKEGIAEYEQDQATQKSN